MIGRYADGDELAELLDPIVASRTPSRDLPTLA